MKKIKLLGLSALMLLIVFSSCRKDIDETTVETNTFEPVIIPGYEKEVENVTARLSGFVVDHNQTPVADANVTMGNLNTTTDAFGHFFFTNVTMNSKGTYVKVEKAGYFLGSRNFYPAEGKESRIKIELIEKNYDQSFSAVSGGTVNSEGMVDVTFAPNSIINADGTYYYGTVSVATAYLNPTANETLDQMPGDLSAVNLSNEVGVLNTYGMVNVELQDAGGNPLNIAPGQTATIEMNVPGVLQPNAPATIPLWSFNEDYGIWVEESSATLTASKYVGEVSHFTWWNCDPFANSVYLDLTLVDHQGLPMPHVQTQLILANQLTFTGTAYTDSSGFITGLVPTGEPIIFNVLDYCGNVIYTQNIGPFSADVSLGSITINNSVIAQTVTIDGELLDCYGYPVTDGVIVIDIDGITVFEYLDNNPFSISIPTCNTTTQVTIKGVDMTNLVESVEATYSVAPTINAGQINVCGNSITNFISYDIAGGPENIIFNAFANSDSIGQQLNISASDIVNYNYEVFASITVPDTIPGTYLNNCYFFIYDFSNGSFQATTSILDTVIVTSVGNTGDQVTGTYSGAFNYSDQYGYYINTTISGSFSAERTD